MEGIVTEQEPKPKRHYKPRKKVNLTNWGGARDGAGRKRLTDEIKKPLSMSVSETCFKQFKELKNRGADPVNVIEDTIGQLAVLMGIKV